MNLRPSGYESRGPGDGKCRRGVLDAADLRLYLLVVARDTAAKRLVPDHPVEDPVEDRDDGSPPERPHTGRSSSDVRRARP